MLNIASNKRGGVCETWGYYRENFKGLYSLTQELRELVV
jgi:hypothetical protein